MQLRGVLRELAMNCAVKQREDTRWVMQLDTSHQQLLSKVRQQRLQEALCACLQKQVELDIEIAGGAADTPALQQQAEAQQRQAAAVDTIESDPNVKAIREAFDATLHTDTIRPLDS
jgi:DNA polymerase-3 subunit gamma/tau